MEEKEKNNQDQVRIALGNRGSSIFFKMYKIISL